MTNFNPPAILSKCGCKDIDCPNQILWINKDKIIDYANTEQVEEIGGCIPIASFTPEELCCLTPEFWEEQRNS